MLENLIIFLVSFILGAITMRIYVNKKDSFGTLLIDKTNPEKDVYRIDVNDFNGIEKKKRVILDVNANADLSQE